HQYYARLGLPWRNRLFGHVARLARWGSFFAPLSNWVMQSRAARWVGEKLLGIDRRRLPPAFARRPLTRLLPPSPAGLPHRALLFPDTFTNFHEPEVGLAAARLLEQAGCSVWLGPSGLRCCGRPLISNGILTEAVAHARAN